MARFQIIGTREQLRDNSGAVLAGGSVVVRAAGTVRDAQTFSDAIGARPNPNPVPVSGSGRCNIWVDQPVDIIVRDANGASIYTESNLNPANVVLGFDSGLIVNGGFERDSNSDGVPDGWTSENNASGSNNGLETGAGNVASGTQSWRTQSAGNGGGQLVTDRFDVNDVDNIIVRFRRRSTVSSVRNIVRVEWSDVTDTPISNTVILDSTSNPATFTQTVATATPPSGARLARVRLLGGESPGTGAGITYWDSFRVERPTIVTGAFGNLLLAANTLSSTDTNGAINLDPNGTGAVNLRAPTNITGDTAVTGASSVSGALSSASLAVSGNASVGGGATITGVASVGSTFSALGDAVVTGTLGVSGDASLSSLSVSTTARVASFLRANSNANVDLTGDSSPLTIAPTTGQHLELDGMSVQGKATQTTFGALQLNTLGGQVEVGAPAGSETVILRNLRTLVEGNQSSPLSLQNRADGAPAAGQTQDIFLTLATSAGVAVGQIGFESSPSMVLRSLNRGGAVLLQGQNAGGVVQNIFRGDPDDSSQMSHAGSANIRTRQHDATSAITGGAVRRRDGVFTDIGSAVLRILTTTDVTSTLSINDVNRLLRRTTNGVWLVQFPDTADIPVGAHGLIHNRRGTDAARVTFLGRASVVDATGTAVTSIATNTIIRWIKIDSTTFQTYTVS